MSSREIRFISLLSLSGRSGQGSISYVMSRGTKTKLSVRAHSDSLIRFSKSRSDSHSRSHSQSDFLILILQNLLTAVAGSAVKIDNRYTETCDFRKSRHTSIRSLPPFETEKFSR